MVKEDGEAVANEIEQMLEKAWKKFCDYYDRKAPEYLKKWPVELDERQAKDSHWICWDENDLTFHIGRFFYDILKEKKESLFSDIEIHFDKKVDRKNFKGYTFKDKLDELKKRLIREGVLKKGAPKVDMIVAKEDSDASLLLCAEAKCFRYPTDWEKAINADIKKLKAIRELGIAKKVVFILFDDYYWCNDEETANAIQRRLEEIRRDGITVLDHTSKAKLPPEVEEAG